MTTSNEITAAVAAKAERDRIAREKADQVLSLGMQQQSDTLARTALGALVGAEKIASGQSAQAVRDQQND